MDRLSEAETQAKIDTTRAETQAKIDTAQAETQAKIDTTRAENAVAVIGMLVDKEKKENERARIRAEKQAIEDQAKADKEERERQRVHAAEVSAERRRAEVRDAAAKGEISQEAADGLLAEHRRTPIHSIETWLGHCVAILGASCRCETPSSCSSQLGRKFVEAVSTGRHVKPLTHWNPECQKWKLFEEHDGDMLRLLHLEIHDRRSGVRPGQMRLTAFASPASER
jgi:hypothetical protein